MKVFVFIVMASGLIVYLIVNKLIQMFFFSRNILTVIGDSCVEVKSGEQLPILVDFIMYLCGVRDEFNSAYCLTFFRLR